MDSRDGPGVVGQIYAKVSSKVIETAMRRGIEAGTRAALNHIEDERQKARKGRADRRLHNTRLLLKNYRLFKRHAEGAIYNVRQAQESAIDILDGLDDYSFNDGLYIESIKQSQQRTLIILSHIEQMLRFYRIDCEQNGNEEDIRRYKVVMATYIDEPKKSALEIAGTFGIERRTVYKDIDAAIKPLTMLFFGIDSIKIN